MRFLHSPAEMPGGIEYYLRTAGDNSPVKDLLRRIRPTSVCVGVIGPRETPGRSLPVVNLLPDWPLLEGQENSMMTLLLPVDYVWGWLAYCSKAMDTLGLGGQPTVGGGELAQRLEARPVDKFRNWNYISAIGQHLHPFRQFIKRVHDGLSDARSREIYSLVFSATPAQLCRRYAENVFSTYQYGEYVNLSPGDVIINCGVAEGFEIPYFLSRLGRSGKIYNLDPGGHRFLSDYTKEIVRCYPNVFEHRLAVGDQSGVMNAKVQDGSGGGGHLATSIDDFVEEQGLDRVDLIKLDIEGSEPLACLGMQETIKSYRPQIAISIYHSIREYWEIPLHLMKACHNYMFFIGHYSYMRYETILYAIPCERVREA